MALSPLEGRSKTKILTERDIPMMKHHFRRVYGWISDDEWDDRDMDKTLEDYPLVQEEIRKQEELRLCTLKFYGVKNPK